MSIITKRPQIFKGDFEAEKELNGYEIIDRDTVAKYFAIQDSLISKSESEELIDSEKEKVDFCKSQISDLIMLETVDEKFNKETVYYKNTATMNTVKEDV